MEINENSGQGAVKKAASVITQNALKLQMKIWEDKAYVNAMNKEICKIRKENKNKKEVIKKYCDDVQNLAEQLENMTIVKEKFVDCNSAVESNVANVKEHAQFVQDQFENENSKIESTLLKSQEDYEAYRAELEETHPLYKELKEARVSLARTRFYFMFYQQQLLDLKRQLRQKREIQQKIFNNSIVQFVKTVKGYQENQVLKERYESLLQERDRLAAVYANMQKQPKKPAQQLPIPEIEMMCTDLQAQVPDLAMAPKPCQVQQKNVSFQLEVLSKFKSSEKLAQNYHGKKQKILQKMRSLETTSNEHNVAFPIIKTRESPKRQLSVPEEVKPTATIFPPPKKLKPILKCTSVDSMAKTGITQAVAEIKLSVSKANPGQGTQSELAAEKNSSNGKEQLPAKPEEAVKRKETCTPTTMFNEKLKSSQTLRTSTQNADNNFKETSFSRQWNDLSPLEAFNMYNMNSGEDAAISNDVSPDFLVSELSKEDAYNISLPIEETSSFLNPNNFTSPREAASDNLVKMETGANSGLNFFKLESGAGAKPAFQFKDNNRFNMF